MRKFMRKYRETTEIEFAENLGRYWKSLRRPSNDGGAGRPLEKSQANGQTGRWFCALQLNQAGVAEASLGPNFRHLGRFGALQLLDLGAHDAVASRGNVPAIRPGDGA
jgi:hypothetical protein